MSRLLYTLLLYLALPLLLLRLLVRSLRAPAYRQRIGERFGYVGTGNFAGGLWVHAVSVGEVTAAVPLVRALLHRHQGLNIVLTTTTPTGAKQVTAQLGSEVLHLYCPWDTPGAIQRFLARVRPRLLLLMETELWPNLIAHCRRREIPVLLLNARLSERSARGYGRIAPLVRSMLRQLEQTAAQTGADAARFRQLGLPTERVHVSGNIKFDLCLSDEDRQRAATLRRQWDETRPVWAAASTHAGEETIVLKAHQSLRARFPSLLLVLVPRHPERFAQVEAMCHTQNLPVVRRTSKRAPRAEDAVLLADTMGELRLLLGTADCAFIGGSLVPTGGHNMLEAAVWGVPILSGPHLFNFAEPARHLETAGALRQVKNAPGLAAAVAAWLDDREARRAAGQAGIKVVENGQGALERQLRLVEEYLGQLAS